MGDSQRTEDPSRSGSIRVGVSVLTSRTALAIGSFIVMAAAMYVGHRLYSGKPVTLPTPKYFPAKKDRPIQSGPLPTAAVDRNRPPVKIETSVEPIEEAKDATPLDAFFAALERTEQKRPGAITRICHFGDSQVVADNITSTVRRRLQGRFGDAGHGFLNVGRHKSYKHTDVRHWTRGWSFAGVVRAGFRDRRYGLAGIHSYARAFGPHARFETLDSFPVGKRVSRFEIRYLVHPQGGRFEVRLDGKVHGTVDTRARTADGKSKLPLAYRREAVYRVTAPDGQHRMKIKALGYGLTRLLGVVMERDGPGLVYDSLGQLGAQMRDYLRVDGAHFQAQLRWRRPNLVVFGFGTNEADQRVPMSEYRKEWKVLLARVRTALPGSSCLVLGPVDKVHRRSSHPRIAPLTKAMRATALEGGCAFWDTWKAMGGKGAAYRWRRAGLYWGDLAHLNEKGGEKLGTLISTAILERYRRWKHERGSKTRRTAPRK